MSSLKMNQILKSDSHLKPQKLTDKKVKKIVQEVKEKQDFIISLKRLNDKDLKSVVQL